MENISRALIISGEVLIAVLIISLAAVLIVNFGKFSSNMNNRLAEDKKAEFNNKFYNFNGRINITADEIASLLNYVKESNDSYEIDLANKENSIFYADILIKDKYGKSKSFFQSDYVNEHKKNGEITKEKFKDAINEFLKKNNNEYFYCNIKKVSINADVGQLTNVTVNIDNKDIIINTDTGLVKSITFGYSGNLPPLKEKGYSPINKDDFNIGY